MFGHSKSSGARAGSPSSPVLVGESSVEVANEGSSAALQLREIERKGVGSSNENKGNNKNGNNNSYDNDNDCEGLSSPPAGSARQGYWDDIEVVGGRAGTAFERPASDTRMEDDIRSPGIAKTPKLGARKARSVEVTLRPAAAVELTTPRKLHEEAETEASSNSPDFITQTDENGVASNRPAMPLNIAKQGEVTGEGFCEWFWKALCCGSQGGERSVSSVATALVSALGSGRLCCCCCCCCCCYCCCCCVCVCVCACVCFQLLVQSRLRSIGFIRRRFAGFLRQCQRFMLAPFFLVDRICVVRHHFVVQFGISRSYRSHRLHLLTPSPIPNTQSPISFYTPTRLFSLV